MDGAGPVDRSNDDPADPLVVAAGLAVALDADDFDTVESMLADDVVYRIGGNAHRGPAEVVASYRDGSATARRIFERVEYSHEILALVADRTVRIDFADGLYANGERFEHHSVQDVEVDRTGRIVSVTDVPVEGERAHLDEFVARHGLSREA